MDAFEQVVSEILWREGFWVRTSVKVALTAEDKSAISRATAPRWELDIVAYRPSDNLLRVIECKSYIDSSGVGIRWLKPGNTRAAGLYKLFSQQKLREIVLARLEHQFVAARLCRPNPKVHLGMACGKIQPKARDALTSHFEANGWDLLDEKWLRTKLIEMAKEGYENQVSAVVAKLILRGEVTGGEADE